MSKSNEFRKYSMNESVLQFLACPLCGDDIRFVPCSDTSSHTDQDSLACAAGCGTYPIRSGVPRLLPELARSSVEDEEDLQRDTGRSFGAQWNMHQYGNTTWGISAEERLHVVLHELGWKESDLADKVILDAGCGNGTLSEMLAHCGATVLAIDLSDSVFRAKQHCSSSGLHFVQGNLFFPPFKRGIVDAIYSCGVFHHTPDTRRCFDALVPMLKADLQACYFVWLYAKRSWLFNVSVEQLMKLTRRLPSNLLGPMCFAMSPLVELGSRIGTRCGVVEYAPRNFTDRAVQLHDLLAPTFVHYHSFDEVQAWASAQGFLRISKTPYQTNGKDRAAVGPTLNKYRAVCRPGFGILCEAREEQVESLP